MAKLLRFAKTVAVTLAATLRNCFLKREELPPGAVVIAFDPHQHQHRAVAGQVGGALLEKPFTVYNSRQGFDFLLKKIAHYLKQTGAPEVYLVFEPTADFFRAFGYLLEDLGYHVHLVNSNQVASMRQALFHNGDKTDDIDAFVILELAVQGYSFQARLHREEFRNLHKAGRERHDLREKQSALQMQITALVQEVFPELRQAFKNLFGQTCLALLETTPLPAPIVALGEDALTERLKAASNRRLGRKKALQLLELARLSIGVTAANEAVVARLQRLVASWRGLHQQLQQVATEMETYLPDAAQPLLRIQGLSTVLVATLLGEIGDWTFFAHATQLVKLAGMSPQRWASGDHQKAPHLSRKGQPLLQYTVYLCALSLVQHNPAFRAYYQSLCQRGKPKMVALCAVGRKFLHVVFAMLQHGTEFDPHLVGAGQNQPTPAD